MTDNELDRVAIFKKSVDKMLATSEDSYKFNPYSSRVGRYNVVRDYTTEEIAEVINSGDVAGMREMSRSYFYGSGFYRRIIFYYGYLLKYSYLVTPHFKKKVNASSKTNYYQALDLCEIINIPNFCEHAAITTLVDGSYFGAVVKQGSQISIMDLPNMYCRTRFKGFSGLDIVEFDLRYFTTIADEVLRDQALNVYPAGVKKAYLQYKKGKINQWHVLPEGTGLYFKMHEPRPFFVNTISAIDNFETYRALEIKKEEMEIKRILVQHLGTKKDGEFIVEPEEAEELHRGAVNMLRKNENLDVLTTYAEVKMESLADSRQTINSNLETFQNMIYAESGASANIFAATGNISLDQSLKNDLSLIMNLAKQFATALTFILNEYVATNAVTYSLNILPISYYNSDEYIEQTFKLATAGYSFLLPGIACGLTQKELLDVKVLENELLELKDMFIPLATSYTDSANEGGNPGKPNAKKTDKTIKNIEGGSK